MSRNERSPTPWLAALVALACPIACTAPAQVTFGTGEVSQPNVLLIVADDLGVDVLETYALGGTNLPSTPTIDQLAAQGLTFEFAYASPTCSPTRANIQTGRYGIRTHVGSGTQPWETAALADEEITLAEMLSAGTNDLYTSGAFGKWHLATNFVGGPTAPNDQGYDRFDGALYNLYQDGSFDFFDWKRVTDGVITQSNTYATSAMVNVTRNWINATPEPWFAYLPFHAPHSPYHEPPSHLHDVDLTGADPDSNPRPLYDAMIEAMDSELERLFKSIPPDVLARTTIIFMGDNGTPGECTEPPFAPEHAKGTPFEGGVRVPLIVSGANVTAQGRTTSALAHAVDLLPTIADLVDVDLAATMPGVVLDGVNLAPLLTDPGAPEPRATVFSQLAYPNTGKAATHCQFDLGFASPGGPELSVCGPHLVPGGDDAVLRVSGAPPNGAIVIAPSLTFAPFAFAGTQLAPGLPWLGVLPAFADATGVLEAPVVSELPPLANPFTLFVQAIVQTAAGPWKLSNAVAIAYEDLPFSRTMIRDKRYKLIRETFVVNGTEVTRDSLYDLAVDPFETNDLFGGGTPGLTPDAQAAYTALAAELDALLASA